MTKRGTFYMIELTSVEECKAASDLAANIHHDFGTTIFVKHVVATVDERGYPYYTRAVYILGEDTKKSRRIKKQFEKMLNTMRRRG